MKISFFCSFFVLFNVCATSVEAQALLLPVKKKHLWGAINPQGQVVIEPIYDAFSSFGCWEVAPVQRGKKIGLIDRYGKEVIFPQYDYLSIVANNALIVKENGVKKLINLQQKTILSYDYDEVKPINEQFFLFSKNEKWGVVTAEGQLLFQPEYEQIEFFKDRFFKVRNEEHRWGLRKLNGEVILPCVASDLKIATDHDCLLFRRNNRWELINLKYGQSVRGEFDQYELLPYNYILLMSKGLASLYRPSEHRFVAENSFNYFYPFSAEHTVAKRDIANGLINNQGKITIPLEYDEIQPYGAKYARVLKNGKWGILTVDNQRFLPNDYEYIAPMQENVAIVSKGVGKLGVINNQGTEIIPCVYSKIEFDLPQIKAYKGTALTLIDLDEDGNLAETNQFKNHGTIRIGKSLARERINFDWEAADFVVGDFEWFQSPRDNKWGLRSIKDGAIIIKPTFRSIQIERNLGFTLVFIDNHTELAYERTHYDFEQTFGIVSNKMGLFIVTPSLTDIRLHDFDEGLPVARCIFTDGKHGLITRRGKIIKKDYAYIGIFNNGLARASVKGVLSGKISTKSEHLGTVKDYLAHLRVASMMSDYTLYDRQFHNTAQLTCEGCLWGYIDTLGNMPIVPQFGMGEEFNAGVGIVQLNNHWGAVNMTGKTIIPHLYDKIEFLQNADNQSLLLSKNYNKYGLATPNGTIKIQTHYDDLMQYAEGRLPFLRAGRWGFMDSLGREVIKNDYKRVEAFSEGLAAVKQLKGWGYVDTTGQLRIPYNYRSVGAFRHGLAAVGTSIAMGYINTDNQFIIAPKYDKASDFTANKTAQVTLKGHTYSIDLRGKTAPIEPNNEATSLVKKTKLNPFRFASNGNLGLLNASGLTVISPKYDLISAFEQGLAKVRLPYLRGVADLNGNLVQGPNFDYIEYIGANLFRAEMGNKVGYFNRSGEWLWELEE